MPFIAPLRRQSSSYVPPLPVARRAPEAPAPAVAVAAPARPEAMPLFARMWRGMHRKLTMQGMLGGRMRYDLDDRSTYEGAWRDGLFHGQGVLRGADGSVYEGNFFAGLRHGRGTLTLADGSWRQGLWSEGHYMGADERATRVTLERCGRTGRAIASWTRLHGRDYFFYHDAEANAAYSLYELTTLEPSYRLARLAELAALQREICAWTPLGNRGDLLVLVRAALDSQFSADYVGATLPELEPAVLDARGGVRALATVQGNYQLVLDASERCEHRVLSAATPAALRQHVTRLQADSFRLAGVAAFPERFVAIFKRPRRADYGATLRLHGQLEIVRRLVRAGRGWEQLPALIDRLQPGAVAAQPQAWAAAVPALRQACTSLGKARWQAYVSLAELCLGDAAVPGQSALDEDLRTGLAQALALDLSERRVHGLCCSACRAGPLHKNVRDVLATALLRACGAEPGPDGAEQQLAQAVRTHSVGAVRLLRCMGFVPASPSAAATPTPHRLAEASGQGFLLAALDDAAALPQWEALLPPQRRSLLVVATQAARHSAAATPALLQRCRALGIDAAAVAQLRRYLRTHAPVWLPHDLSRDDHLLHDHSLGSRLCEMPQLMRRFYGGSYAAFARRPDVLPKVAWLNAAQAYAGLSPEHPVSLCLVPEVLLRSTLVLSRPGNDEPLLATPLACDHLLLALEEKLLRRYVAASAGSQAGRPAFDFGGKNSDEGQYIEVHVHGSLLLHKHVRNILCMPHVLVGGQHGRQALQRLVQASGRTPQWRGALRLHQGQRADALMALAEQDVGLATWTSSGRDDTYVLAGAAPVGRLLPPTPGPLTPRPLGRHYAFHVSALRRARQLVTNLGREQQTIVGMAVLPAALGDKTWLRVLAGTDPYDPGPFVYTWRRTTLPLARLEALSAAGWHVVAYAQSPICASSLRHHYFVARQNTTHVYEHDLRLVAKAEASMVRDQLAPLGWQLCGAAQHDEAHVALVFRRVTGEVVLPADSSDEDDDAPCTLIHHEPLHTVPETLRFTSASGMVFDVDELVDMIEETGAFRDFYTNAPLSGDDIARLRAHPSGAGEAL